MTKEIRNRYKIHTGCISVTCKTVFRNARCFQVASMHLYCLPTVTESQRRMELYVSNWLKPLRRSENTMVEAGTLLSLDTCSLRNSNWWIPQFLQTLSGTNSSVWCSSEGLHDYLVYSILWHAWPQTRTQWIFAIVSNFIFRLTSILNLPGFLFLTGLPA